MLFLTLVLLGLLFTGGAVAYILLKFGQDLPDYKQLKNYSPPLSAGFMRVMASCWLNMRANAAYLCR